MSAPWPAPNVDERRPSRERHPNYLLRRAVAAAVAAALLTVVVAGFVVFSRGNDTPSDGGTTGISEWNTVVTQDRASGIITTFDRDGSELSTVNTTLIGLGDVGLDGVVLVGTQGDTAAAGVGLLDLTTGRIRPLAVHTTLLDGAEGQPFRVGFAAATNAVELLDARRGTVTDLLRFTDADNPVVLPEFVRVGVDGNHAVFTELTRSSTIAVDLETSTAVTMPGTLADIAFDSIVTLTNRGDTVLLDRYDLAGALAGERTGTVETPTPAVVMLVDATTAIAVDTTGTIRIIDFAAETTTETGTKVGAEVAAVPASRASVADAASSGTGSSAGTIAAGDPAVSTPTAAEPTATGGGGQGDGQGDGSDSDSAPTTVVLGGTALMGNTRLAVFTSDGVTVLDADGASIGALAVTQPHVITGLISPRRRCLTVTSATLQNSVLIDVAAATALGSFATGTSAAESADGCTVAVMAGSGGTTVLGPSIDRTIDASIRTVSADGTAMLRVAADGITILPVISGGTDGGSDGGTDDGTDDGPTSTGGEGIELTQRPGVAVFATR